MLSPPPWNHAFLLAGGERKRRKSSGMSEKRHGYWQKWLIQVPQILGYHQFGAFCSVNGLSGFFASTLPLLSASLYTIQPWMCWGRRSSLLWLFCSSIHLSLLHLSVQLILSQDPPGDERRVMSVVSCCIPVRYICWFFFPTETPQPLKIWTS